MTRAGRRIARGLIFWILPVVLTGCATTGPLRSPPSRVEFGIASYYGREFHGRPTASGEIYDEDALTAAHRSHDFGVLVRVTNLNNEKSVILRINDRGPWIKGRIIDVSRRAARDLDFIREGLVEVEVEVVGE